VLEVPIDYFHGRADVVHLGPPDQPDLEAVGESRTPVDFEIPMAGVVAADDTEGRVVDFEHDGDSLLIPAGTTHVKIRGDSMAPAVCDGQIAFIDSEDRAPRDGDIVAVQFRDGRSYLKHFYEIAGSIHPIPSSFSWRRHASIKTLTKRRPLGIQPSSYGPSPAS